MRTTRLIFARAGRRCENGCPLDDVRYILRVPLSMPLRDRDGLEVHLNRRIIMTFDAAETATGHDRGAPLERFGAAGSRGPLQMDGRAQD